VIVEFLNPEKNVKIFFRTLTPSQKKNFRTKNFGGQKKIGVDKIFFFFWIQPGQVLIFSKWGFQKKVFQLTG